MCQEGSVENIQNSSPASVFWIVAEGDEHDEQIAAGCVRSVMITTCPPEHCIPVWKKRGFESVEICLIDSMVCYVLQAKGLTVIVFRGTDDPFDWVANADDRGFPLKAGTMHRGFWDAYQRLKPQLTEYLLNDEPEFV